MTMIKNIHDKLMNDGWTTSDETTYTRSVNVPVRTVVVNGQKSVQTAELTMSITYIGEGSMWAPYEEDKKVPLYGFTFTLGDNATDIWVENDTDFEFWYDQYKFSKMNYATD